MSYGCAVVASLIVVDGMIPTIVIFVATTSSVVYLPLLSRNQFLLAPWRAVVWEHDLTRGEYPLFHLKIWLKGGLPATVAVNP